MEIWRLLFKASRIFITEEDEAEILRRINYTDGTFEKPIIYNKRQGEKTSAEWAKDFFKELPNNFVESMIKLYKFDFEAFGYDYRVYLKE